MEVNYMDNVAKMLGVELGEKFYVEESNGRRHSRRYRLTDEGLEYDYFEGWDTSDINFMDFLTGKLKIIKNSWHTDRDWRPTDGEEYWYLTYEGNAIPARFKNDFTTVHQMRVRIGNFFKTEPEAEFYKEKWLAYYNQGADMSWRD